MAEETFVHKILDKLLEVIEVELKLPLGIAEVKMSPTAIAKEWRENQKKRSELENAIQRAEEKFTADHKDKKVAQMLHELPLYSDEDFKQVIAGLLTHLSEEKITWLAEVTLTKTWGKVASTDEIRKALELYLPYLRHELNSIKEFREVISALTLERVDKNTQETVEIVREIRSDLKDALKQKDITKDDEPDFWFFPHPYPMPPNFTGRAAEQKMLDDWLADNTNRLFILRALGGFGKSALIWQWINTHVNPTEWTKLVWWSFYEGDASFEHFIEETLKYFKLEVPQGQRPQVDALLKAMQSQKILLVMDGFERALRAYSSMNAAYQGDESPLLEGEGKGDGAYDCVNINAEIFLKSVCSLPNMKSKVLMTTRLTPRTVKPRGEFMLGCREEELTAMQKADAVEFFHKQNIKGTHAEIEAACAPYGYHPLSLRLLAGRIVKDFENPADIVVAQKLKIDGDLKQHQHHVLEVSYNSLPQHEQKLLSTIACFRSTVTFDILRVIAKHEEKTTGRSYDVVYELHDLVERGLLQHEKEKKKFDLHPIVRHYAYNQFSESDRKETHFDLAIFFSLIFSDSNQNIETLDDLAPIIELYYHMVKAEKLDEARLLFRDRLQKEIYYQLGGYQLQIELLSALFLDGEDKPPRLKTESSQAWTLNELANAYSLSGQPRRAVPLLGADIAILEKAGVKNVLPTPLGNVAEIQLSFGAIQGGEANLRRMMLLAKETENDFHQARGHLELGRLLSYRGAWNEIEQELDKGLALFKRNNHIQGMGQVWLYRSLYILLLYRDPVKIKHNNPEVAIKLAKHSLELAEEIARTVFPVERDFVRAHWLLGAAYHFDNQLASAENHLSEALMRCRAINNVEHEANILLDLARLRYAQNDFKDALEKASEALMITERSGYVLQGADVNLFLATLALEGYKLEGLKVLSDKDAAIHHAKEALRLAHCDDGPPYYYKVAYEEAERFLENLK